MVKVGIYMPSWKTEKYIAETISSIQAQTFSDWELVIIDDHSPDNTFVAATDAAAGDDRITVLRRKEHAGRIGQVKNEAIGHLGPCEYICHVGSDDTIPPHCLELFTKLLDSEPDVGAACGTFLAFNDEGKQWEFPHVTNDKGFSGERLMRYMCLYPMRFYRRRVVEQVGGYSNELTSAVDYDLALKLDEVTSIARIEQPVTYYYRQHHEQVSTRARPEQNKNAKKALQDALVRRGLSDKLEVANDAPPFRLQEKIEEHFIWGSK